MNRRFLVITVACVLGLVTALGAAHGAFTSVRIGERVSGPYEFIYRTAPHGDFGSVRTITTELEEALRAGGVREAKPFDVFYPANTDSSEIGFIVAQQDVAKILALPRPPRYRMVPQQEFLTTTLPYRSPLSFVVGFWKVDPRLREYRGSRGLKETWAATINMGDTIVYLQPKAPRDRASAQ